MAVWCRILCCWCGGLAEELRLFEACQARSGLALALASLLPDSLCRLESLGSAIVASLVVNNGFFLPHCIHIELSCGAL